MQAAFRSFQRVRSGDESDLQTAVALEGPIAVAVDAKHNTFRVNYLMMTMKVMMTQ